MVSDPDLEIDIQKMMLAVGCLAVRPTLTQHAINCWWAWLRYSIAFHDSDRFALRSEYESLDPHQKTILSDDFGMGAALTYLEPLLNFQQIVDGRYFVDFLKPAVRAKVGKVSANGQYKCPDFMCLDNSGKWHVVECKGTQQSLKNQLAQLKNGRKQKVNIKLPASVRGEKLVTALIIGRHDGPFSSSFRIEDPDDGVPFSLEQSDMPEAQEAATRATIARTIGLAGLPACAAIIASPFGSRPSDRPSRGKKDEKRREAAAKCRLAALEELDRVSQMSAAPHSRRIAIDLPVPLVSGDKTYRSISASIQASEEIMETVDEIVRGDKLAITSAFDSHVVAGIKWTQEGESTTLKVGNHLIASVQLNQSLSYELSAGADTIMEG